MPSLAVFSPKVEYKEIEIEDIPAAISSKNLTWVNCIGLGNDQITGILKAVKEIPDFLIEDCTTKQRPKFDDYDKIISIIFKIIKLKNSNASSIQVNLIFGRNFLMTISEHDHPVFDAIKNRIERHRKRINSIGVGHLVYIILESIADTYFPLLEKIDDDIEYVEGRLLKSNSLEHLHNILNLRNLTLRMRRNIYPEKEILRTLGRDKYRLVSEDSHVYFRDCYSDIISISERIENQREHLSSLMEIYTSTMSNNLNVIVKTLTVITSLVLVPGLIASIYGMNVKGLPWADNQFSFEIVSLIMVVVFAAMVLAFKSKKWI